MNQRPRFICGRCGTAPPIGRVHACPVAAGYSTDSSAASSAVNGAENGGSSDNHEANIAAAVGSSGSDHETDSSDHETDSSDHEHRFEVNTNWDICRDVVRRSGVSATTFVTKRACNRRVPRQPVPNRRRAVDYSELQVHPNLLHIVICD